jgi:hypothetical protein
MHKEENEWMREELEKQLKHQVKRREELPMQKKKKEYE